MPLCSIICLESYILPEIKTSIKKPFPFSSCSCSSAAHTHTHPDLAQEEDRQEEEQEQEEKKKKKRKKTQNKVDCKAPAHGCAWAKHVQVSKERLLRGIRLPTSVKEADENTVGTGSASITCFWSPVTERTLTQRVKKINTTCRMS